MNICIINYRYFVSGGPERYMFSIMEKLEEAGHRVVPFSFAYRDSVQTKYAEYFADPPGGPDAAWFKDLKLSPAQKVGMLTQVIYNRDAKAKLKRLLREQEIDLVYGLQIVNTLYPSVVDACVEMGVPIIHRLSDFQYLCANYKFFRDGHICEDCLHGAYYHGVQHTCLKGSLAVSGARVFTMYLDRVRGTRHKIDAFVSPSKIVHDKMIEGGFPRAKMHHIPTFVDVSDKEPVYRAGSYVLYAGAIDPFKGVRELLEAWAMLGDTRDIRLVYAGYSLGDEVDVLQQRIAAEGIADVEFTGFKSGAELTQLYQSALCVVMPTLWYENIPNTVLEAMAYGKPVVGSDLGGVAEIIEHGESGLLSAAGDVAGLSANLRRLIDGREAAERLGRNARRRVESTFSPERHCERLFALMEAVVGAKSSRE